MRLFHLSLLALLLIHAQCAPTVRSCAPNTIFVRLSLMGAAAEADTLLVAVRVGSGAAMSTPLARTTALTQGGLAIAFPNGYPSGQTVTVAITAQKSGIALDTQSTTVTLDAQCASVSISLGSVASDLGGADLAAVDLAGVDAPPAPFDLADGDTAVVDLAAPQADGMTADLAELVDGAPASDLVCAGFVEDCFNNNDDDCDGLVDCADPDCTAGGSPTAECIPTPGTTTFGTSIAGSGACPTAYPTSKAKKSDFQDSSCQSGSCSASGNPQYACKVTLTDYANSTSCGGSSRDITVDSAQGCTTFSPIPMGHSVFVSGVATPTYKSGSCNASGTSTKIAAKFNVDELFCQRSAVGGGCAIGNVCVPRATNYCYEKSVIGACAAGYTLVPTSFATGINAQKTCSCQPQTFQGTCAVSNWGLHGSTSCGDSRITVPSSTCDMSNYSTQNAMEVGAPTSPASCSAVATATGTDAPIGSYFLCCR